MNIIVLSLKSLCAVNKLGRVCGAYSTHSGKKYISFCSMLMHFHAIILILLHLRVF